MEWYFQELVVGLLYVVFAALIFDIVRRWVFRRREWGNNRAIMIFVSFGSLVLVMPFIHLISTGMIGNQQGYDGYLSSAIGCAWVCIFYYRYGNLKSDD